MKTVTFYILLLFAVQLVSAQIIDSKNSEVTFKVDNMNVRTVKGKFTQVKGVVTLNESDYNESYFNVCINTESLQTDTKRRDNNLKKKAFFDVANYPEICFESDSVMKIFGDYIVTGRLTMLGVTKSIKIPLNYTNETLTGSFEINRKDFNLGKNISSFMIDDSVFIGIECKLKKDKLVLNSKTDH